MKRSGIFLPSNALGAFAEAFRDSCAARLRRSAHGFAEAADRVESQTPDTRIRERMGERVRLDIENNDFLDDIHATAKAFDGMRYTVFCLQRLADAQETPELRHLIELEDEVGEQVGRWMNLERSPALAIGLRRAWTLQVGGSPTLHWGEIAAIDATTREVAFRHIRRDTGYGDSGVSGLCLVLAEELQPLPTRLLY